MQQHWDSAQPFEILSAAASGGASTLRLHPAGPQQRSACFQTVLQAVVLLVGTVGAAQCQRQRISTLLTMSWCVFAAGLFEGVPVSIITTLMGMPNMDFVVREARAAVSGHMAIVRLGTCGALRPPARLGSFMIASPGAVCVR
jgi:nucleoside phosphorylase